MSESNEYNPYTAGVMSLPATREPRYSPVQPQEYNPYDTPAMRGGTSAGYPDMTPGPPEPRKPILSTSFDKVPTDTRPAGFWETMLAPGEGNVRVGTAMKEAYRDTPPIVGPVARDWINRQDRVPRAILGTAADVGDMLTKGAAAAGTGITANISELLSGGNPQLARDLTLGQQVLPVAQALAPRFTGPWVSRKEPYGPPNPQREALPINTAADALRVYKPLIKSAETSDFRLNPEWTQNWVKSLDDYDPRSAALKAAEPEGNAVNTLVDKLRATVTGPLDNVTSIQEIDQLIQRHRNQQYGQGGDPHLAGQMTGILKDFRERYGNIPDDQFTGNPQGVKDFKSSIKGYSQYSKMRDVEEVIKSTQGNPNRATLISSRVHGFLNDDDNVRGWSTAEKDSLRKAVDAGFLQEWLRAQGSRLVGIGAAVTGGLGGQALSVPAQVGLSYGLRNAAEVAKLAKIQQAMRLLGQGVPQPGTLPARTVLPPPTMMRPAARYAPLVGLLGQSIANEEASR